MIPAPEAIISLIHGLAVDEGVTIASPHFRVLQAVAVRIGTAGFCWADARDLAEAAAVTPDMLMHSLRRWSRPPLEGDPSTGVLQRVDARSGPWKVRRHSLYYCPRLTGISAPGRKAFLVLCEDLGDACEPQITHVDGRPIIGAANIAASDESTEVGGD